MALDKNKQKSINALMNKINSTMKMEAVNMLGNVQDKMKIRFLKTPSHEVNAMLGGGICRGRITEIYGRESSGKTSMALEIIAKAQREPGNENLMTAWLETEGSVDTDYLDYFGIDQDRILIISQTEELSAEKCMDILRSLISSGEFEILVLNSVAGLLPSKEVEDEMGKQNIALTARLLSKFLRITTGMLTKNNTSLILINQVRTNLNSMYSVSTTTGGMAIPFYASQRIEMKREKVMAGDPITEDDGVKVRCKVVKNRLAKGNPYKVCNYYALYGKGIDGVSELGTVLAREGVLTKSGSWLKLVDDNDNLMQVKTSTGMVDAKWQSNAKFVDFVRENPISREYFEKLLDEKLSTGKIVGNSVSKEEMEELEQLNIQIDRSSEVAATK